MPAPSPVRHGTASCRLLVLSSTGVVHRCPSAGLMDMCDHASFVSVMLCHIVLCLF